MPLISYFLTSSYKMPMSPNYGESTDIELQSRGPTTYTRAPGQLRSGYEDDVHSPAPTASSSKRTTDLPETSTKLTHALKHLSWELDTQDAKLRSGAFTSDTKRLPIDHKLRKEVRDWVQESLERTENGSRPTLPPLLPGVDRFLTGRAASRDAVTREAVKLVRNEAESIARETGDSIATKTIPGGERKEEDKAKIGHDVLGWICITSCKLPSESSWKRSRNCW
jgi:hypothetical protein